MYVTVGYRWTFVMERLGEKRLTTMGIAIVSGSISGPRVARMINASFTRKGMSVRRGDGRR